MKGRHNQRDRILALLKERENQWVPLTELDEAVLLVDIPPDQYPNKLLREVEKEYIYELEGRVQLVHDTCAAGPGIRFRAVDIMTTASKVPLKPKFSGAAHVAQKTQSGKDKGKPYN